MLFKYHNRSVDFRKKKKIYGRYIHIQIKKKMEKTNIECGFTNIFVVYGKWGSPKNEQILVFFSFDSEFSVFFFYLFFICVLLSKPCFLLDRLNTYIYQVKHFRIETLIAILSKHHSFWIFFQIILKLNFPWTLE